MGRRTAWGVVLVAATACSSGSGGAGSVAPPAEEGRPGPTAGAVDEIDLLLMIDDSPGMGDKQRVLALTIPDLVSRLVNLPRSIS